MFKWYVRFHSPMSWTALLLKPTVVFFDQIADFYS